MNMKRVDLVVWIGSFIWFLISSVGFLYMVFHIGNYIFTNAGYLEFWAISINMFIAFIICMRYIAEMQNKGEQR